MFLPPKTRRIHEGPKGGRRHQSIICPAHLPESLALETILAERWTFTTRKDPSHTKFSSVQLLNWTVSVQLFETPWTTAYQASLSFTTSQRLLRLISIELVMPSNDLILCCPFSSFPQSFLVLGSFRMSWLFTSGGQSIGASASVSVPFVYSLCY